MTPAERIADSHEAFCEWMRDPTKHPWYTSTFRLRQWQENFAAYQFGWFIREARRVGGREVWEAITDQFLDWTSDLVH